MDSRLGAIGGQAADGYETYPDVDALQCMGRSPPASVQGYPVRPEDSVSMTARHGRGSSNVLSGRPSASLEQVNEEPRVSPVVPHSVLYNWKWDFLSAILTIASLAGIFVLLYRYNQRSLRQWHHGITINTVLSILSSAITALTAVIMVKCLEQLKLFWFRRKGQPLYDILVLDEASRGWPGAMKLLFKIHPVHMATAASLLFLLSFTVGPFVQQAVTIHFNYTHQSMMHSGVTDSSGNTNDTRQYTLDSTTPILIVEWRWLVLPAVIVLLSALIFVSTMVRTRHEHTRSSSALELILLGAQIAKASRGPMRPVRLADFTIEDLAKTSRNFNVRYDGRQWHVARNSQHGR